MSLVPNRSMRRRFGRGVSSVLAAALAIAAGCAKRKDTRLPIETSAVVRRTIISEATASGSVEPINVVDVRSKSSGQIIEMTVETGSQVKRGDLLVQLDTRDVKNQWEQSKADLDAAQAKLAISTLQLKRNRSLADQRIITTQELEASQLDSTNSASAVIRAQTSLDLAQQRLEDATVRAPVGGTVIAKTVSLGQVIASATSSASGGTSLLQMANLSTVRVRANFNETDIANVHPGQEATATFDAYPDRPFRGIVEKIEPQAVVQQSVTMFPVLVTLDNLEGLLKPGMNGEVSVLVDTRENVLAVPNDAIRQTREAATTAKLLGLNPDSVVASVQEQQRAMMSGGFNGNGGSMPNGRADSSANHRADSAGRKQMESKGEVATSASPQGGQGGNPDMQRMRATSDSIYKSVGLDAQVARACSFRERMQSGGFGQRGQGGQGGGSQRGQRGTSGEASQGAQSGQGTSRGGGGMNLPEVTDQDCARVKDVLAKHPKAEQMLAAMRGQGRANQGGVAGSQSAVGNPGTGQRARSSQSGSGRGAGAGAPVRAGEFSLSRQRNRPAIVYVAQGTGYVPRVIRSGLSDLDYTEVVAGLQEGERVVLLAAVQLQAQRDSANARAKQMQGLPGMQKGGGIGTPGGPGGGGQQGPGRRGGN